MQAVSARVHVDTTHTYSQLRVTTSTTQATLSVTSHDGSQCGVVAGAIHNAPHESISADTFRTATPFAWWGQWAAAFTDAPDQLSLVRDELGREPLFYAHTQEGVVFGTFLEDVVACISPHPSLNWEHITQFVSAGHARSGHTPFAEVHSVPHNTVVTLTPKERAQHHYWDPFHFSSAREEKTPNQLAEVLCSSVEAWTRPYDNVVLRFSGGIDSSAIAWACREIGQDITAVHTYAPGFNHADERRYAQYVADSLGTHLVTLKRTPGQMVNDPDQPCHRPDYLTSGVAYAGETEDFRQWCGNSSLFLTGGGGDQVFFTGSDRPFHTHEILRRHGVRATWRELLECSTRGFGPLHTLVAEFLRNEFRVRQGSNALMPHTIYRPPTPDWVNTSSAESENTQIAALSELTGEEKKCTPAELAHVVETLSTEHTVDCHPRWVLGVGMVLPLLSRPLVEHQLHTPILSLWDGDEGRKTIRAILNKHLPVIAQRRTKAVFSGVYHAAWKEHAHEITHLVGEGVLARNNMIQRDKALSALQRFILSGDADEMQGLVRVIAAERWLRAWGFS